MGFLTRSKNVLSWSPPVVGTPCHVLSLTADEGTWVKLDDFRDQVNVVFLFVSSIQNDENNDWLKDFNRYTEQFQSLDTVVYGVNTARTDELRAHRTALGIDFRLLYDPLAIESRAMRCSSRVAPVCKTTAVVVGKGGTVIFSERGHAPPSAVLEAVARAEGRDAAELQPASDTAAAAPPKSGTSPVKTIDSLAAEAMMDQKDGGYILIDVRTWSEYEADHSPDAVHIPIDELPQRYGELNQTTRLICVCQAGGRSAAAAEFLTSIGGSEIYNVAGGMSAWSGRRVTGGKLQS